METPDGMQSQMPCRSCKFSPFGLFHSLLDFQPIPQRYTDVLSGQDGDLLQELIDHIIRSSCW